MPLSLVASAAASAVQKVTKPMPPGSPPRVGMLIEEISPQCSKSFARSSWVAS